jgi:hypothetical protein
LGIGDCRITIRGVNIVGHMALTALAIGTVAAVLGTGRVSVPLVASTTVMWSWVPVVQLLTGYFFVGRVPRRGEALIHYFETGVYWATWLLLFALAVVLAPHPFAILDYALATAVVPVVLTARALTRLRRQRFGERASVAWRHVLVHQAVTHAIVVGYFAWAVALWPRVLAQFGA